MVAMKTTIDAAGQLVIPKEVRVKAVLGPGVVVDIRYVDGIVEIEPEPPKVRFVREGHALVAAIETDVNPPTSKEVAALIEAIRDERGTGAE